MSDRLLVSAIVPVHNARQDLDRCLDALLSSSYQHLEILVVDDASTDNVAPIAREKGIPVVRQEVQSGPAAARNLGVRHAKGEILFFVDSDVVVKTDSIERLVENFQSDPDTAAVFGSYDDTPAASNFVSQYKNLFHHFVHQESNPEAVTFWAGCGAIRRDVFEATYGFDQERYSRPSIEDIELGNRLTRMDYRIVLDKHIQAQHLKRWTFSSLIRTDIFCRAVPWSKLMLEAGQTVKDLNLKQSHRISTGLVGLSFMMVPFSFLEIQLLYLMALCLIIILGLNWKLYRFFFEKRGFIFAAAAFPMHLLYYLYSGAAFTGCWFIDIMTSKPSGSPENLNRKASRRYR